MQKVRKFPGRDMVGFIKVQHKSHVSKVNIAGVLYSRLCMDRVCWVNSFFSIIQNSKRKNRTAKSFFLRQGMFIWVVSCPHPAQNSDGKIRIWRVCAMKEPQRTTARCNRVQEYGFNDTIDSAWSESFCVHTLLQEIKKQMPWLAGKDAIVQQDRVTPHTGNDTPRSWT